MKNQLILNHCYFAVCKGSSISHHGVLGMKWGIRRYQPYGKGGYNPQNKGHFVGYIKDAGRLGLKNYGETTLKKGKTLHTLSMNPDRLKNADVFYAAIGKRDKLLYRALFSKSVNEAKQKVLKYDISTKAAHDISIAGENTGARHFMKLYKENKDLRDYVLDPDRMDKTFVQSKKQYVSYADAFKALERMRNDPMHPSEKDMLRVYRIFNYVLPNTDRDTITQRNALFASLKQDGYGGLFDTNDGHYGAFKAHNPAIIFDVESIIPDKVKQLKVSEVLAAKAVLPLIRSNR